MIYSLLHIVSFFQATSFKFIDKEEEPPIRTFDHGIFGEGVSAEIPPHPYMVRGRSGKWYHGPRCDMNICDELCHATPQLRQIFGPEDSENAASFRLVNIRLLNDGFDVGPL